MASNKFDLYKNLYDSYKKCYPNFGGQRVQEETNKFWKQQKAEYGKDFKTFEKHISDKIKKLNEEATKKRSNIVQFFVKVCRCLSTNVPIYLLHLFYRYLVFLCKIKVRLIHLIYE